MSQFTITTNLTCEHKNQATNNNEDMITTNTTITNSNYKIYNIYNIKYTAIDNNKNKLSIANGRILTYQYSLWKNVCKTVNSLLNDQGYNQVTINNPIPFGYNDCCTEPLFNGTFSIKKKVSDPIEYDVIVRLSDFREDQLKGITDMFDNETLGDNILKESWKGTPQFDIVEVNKKSKEHNENHVLITYTSNTRFYDLDVSFDVCKIFISLFWF